MLGDSLLVAPVFSETGEVTYYLPQGKWLNFITGEEVVGGRYIKETHDYMSLPLMVRPNSLIAIGESDTQVEYDFANHVTLHLMNIKEGSIICENVRDINGNIELTVSVSSKDGILFVQAKGSGKPWSIIIRNKYEVEKVSGGNIENTPQGVKIVADRFEEAQIVINM